MKELGSKLKTLGERSKENISGWKRASFLGGSRDG
jgi:hypothetical protein